MESKTPQYATIFFPAGTEDGGERILRIRCDTVEAKAHPRVALQEAASAYIREAHRQSSDGHLFRWTEFCDWLADGLAKTQCARYGIHVEEVLRPGDFYEIRGAERIQTRDYLRKTESPLGRDGDNFNAECRRRILQAVNELPQSAKQLIASITVDGQNYTGPVLRYALTKPFFNSKNIPYTQSLEWFKAFDEDIDIFHEDIDAIWYRDAVIYKKEGAE